MGSRKLDYLGVLLDTEGMGVYVADRKVSKVQKMA